MNGILYFIIEGNVKFDPGCSGNLQHKLYKYTYVYIISLFIIYNLSTFKNTEEEFIG